MDKSLYTRPNKPRRTQVKERRGMDAPAFDEIAQPVEVHTFTECHVTPSDVAERMAGYLALSFGDRVLEPSAGTGNLIDAVLNTNEYKSDYNIVINAVERHYNLADTLRTRFESFDVRIEQSCFLEFALATDLRFDKIIMNPPFKNVRAHMKTALNLLKTEDSALVALVPVTYQHEDMHELETLGPDTFATAKVNTKIIKFEY